MKLWHKKNFWNYLMIFSFNSLLLSSSSPSLSYSMMHLFSRDLDLDRLLLFWTLSNLIFNETAKDWTLLHLLLKQLKFHLHTLHEESYYFMFSSFIFDFGWFCSGITIGWFSISQDTIAGSPALSIESGGDVIIFPYQISYISFNCSIVVHKIYFWWLWYVT